MSTMHCLSLVSLLLLALVSATPPYHHGQSRPPYHHGQSRPPYHHGQSRPSYHHEQSSQRPCQGNTPSTRDQWCEFDIHSDYYSVLPFTGVTREYWLEISEVVVALDGVPRKAQAVNKTIPGKNPRLTNNV